MSPGKDDLNLQVMIICIANSHLSKQIQKYAEEQKVTVSQFVEAALERLDELELLGKVIDKDKEKPEQWGDV